MSRDSDPEFRRNFRTPETTDEAYRFGYVQGELGYKRFARMTFFRNADEADFPFPSSLYRAYRRGWEAGQAKRRRKRARKLAESASLPSAMKGKETQ